MKRKRRIFGFTLIELLVVVAIIALLISILLPSLSRARELSKRVVCASNESGLGKSCKIYANDNEELWPVPGFSSAYTNTGTNRIKYVKDSTNGVGGTGAPFPPNAGSQTPNRSSISQADNPPAGAQASTQLSVTRALWMLVRSGDVQTKGFVCPSSGDTTDPTTEIDAYYDFMDIANISYGYLVPFGPTQTRPSENLDSRLALSADKGPLYENTSYPFTSGTQFPDEKSSPNDWRAYNSGNHGGRGAGEGQNVLFHDGHSSFERTPIVGVDQDNIYTVMINGDQAAQPNKQGRQIGGSPHVANASYAPANPAPGDRTFKGTTGFGNYATTDSLIYP